MLRQRSARGSSASPASRSGCVAGLERRPQRVRLLPSRRRAGPRVSSHHALRIRRPPADRRAARRDVLQLTRRAPPFRACAVAAASACCKAAQLSKRHVRWRFDACPCAALRGTQSSCGVDPLERERAHRHRRRGLQRSSAAHRRNGVRGGLRSVRLRAASPAALARRAPRRWGCAEHATLEACCAPPAPFAAGAAAAHTALGRARDCAWRDLAQSPKCCFDVQRVQRVKARSGLRAWR